MDLVINIVEITVRDMGLDMILEGQSNPWRKAEENLFKDSEENHRAIVKEQSQEGSDGESSEIRWPEG